MYKHLIRPVLFRFDAEGVHHFSFSFLRFLFLIPGMGWLFRQFTVYDDPALEREVFGLKFRNPIGLAAGFDKDALLGPKWRHFGFGFVELGTVTPRPQAGNPRPRLFRLPKDQAIINRMGFNNAGVDAMVERLKKFNKQDTIIGANIGKNKDTPNEQAVEDYEICFQKLFPYVDYFVVNVSSPNTPGLRELQEKEPLTRLLSHLQKLNQAASVPKPLLLKIAPDLTQEQLDDIIEVAVETQLDGLIANNTTISREGLNTPEAEVAAMGNGGLSGLPLTGRSWTVLDYLRTHAPDNLYLIGVGGIMEGLDAKLRMEAGADLIQVYTGFVYHGPGFVYQLAKAISYLVRSQPKAS
ncbi:MAG: quinone-dependent dihydroorotate dehydrogenase [Bacteroidota bacterium]